MAITALIVGVDGMIGAALEAALLARGDRVVGTTRRPVEGPDGARIKLDLADPAAVAQADFPAVDVAIICAAMARYADCREQPERARQVNVTAAAEVARRVVGQGGHVILLSTSAVFDCRTPRMPADAPSAPTSAYGRLKAEAERAVLQHAPNASVLRLTKVMTPGMPLIANWVAALRRGEPIEAFSDLTIAPIRLEDVVAALLAVIDDRGGGIYQASGTDDLSYADIAGILARALGAHLGLVREAKATNKGIPEAEVARFTSLDTSRLAGLGWRRPEDARDVIEALAQA